MKKIFSIFVAVLISVAMWADDPKQGGTISSTPAAPIDPSATVTLTYDGSSTNFATWTPKCHIYAWLTVKSGQTFSKSYGMDWASCNGDADYDNLASKVKMTYSGTPGIYTISMNIKSFFNVAEADLAKIGKLGVVVRAQYSGNNNQTEDMFLNVAVPDPNKFYITGNAALLTDVGSDKAAWTANAIPSENDSYTLTGLKANVVYQLKVIEDGDWEGGKVKGFSDLTSTATGLTKDNDGNICFKLSAAGNVVVNYTSTVFTLTGSFVQPVDVKFVPCVWNTAGAKFAAWTWGTGHDNWTPLFTGAGDTLTAKVSALADSAIFVRLNSALTEPKWNTETEKDNVWNEAEKTKIDKVGLTYTITGWGEGEGAKSTGTWESVGKYFITGDTALVVDAGLEATKAWHSDAIKALKDTCVLKNLKANKEYNLKIIDNGNWKGYTDLTILDDGLSTKGDNNIKFTLNSASDVKVIYTGEVFKLLGDFKEPEFDPAIQQRLKLVPHCWGEANAKIAAYTWGSKIEGKWTGFFAGYNESDTLRATIRTAADSMALVRFASDVEHPSWDEEDTDNPDDDNVWNKIDKILIDHTGLVYTIVDWSTGTWDSFIPATFYATGDSALVVDAGFDKAKAWNADAIKAIADTLVLKDLKAGQDYMLKVTLDGTWEGENNVKGYDELTEKTDGLLRGTGEQNNNNICFKLNTAGDVKIVYTSSLFKLIGDFYVKTYETKTVQLVPSEEWLVEDAKFAAWTWGAEQDGKWSSFFAPKSVGNDTLVATIKTSADSIDFVRFSSKAKTPSWVRIDSLNNVLVWGELKDTIDWKGLTATIVGWDSLTWKSVEHSCESFGLLINGVYHPAKKNVLQTEWLEYKLLSVELKKNDSLQVRDNCNDANWAINKYASTSYEFEIKNNKYVVANDGTYDFYLKFIPDKDEIYISKAGHYTQSVPSQCEDVLMQAFFNESYSNDAPGVGNTGDYPYNLGNTKWETLLPQASEIGHYFDLVWLPPSSNGSGMGYHPKEYSNQSSNWGSASELASLISALHTYNTKVVADVVINHCEGWTTWCDFPTFDFGDYGTFYPDASYICQNDEVNFSDAAKACKGAATGNYDDGENWDGARDWAHDMPKVQDMFKAYLQWLKNTVGYDGFRYDKGDGFNNWHHDNYNKAAGPYIAFMECYSNTDEIWRRIVEANYNLMGLDFDTKWHVFNSFQDWNFSRGRGEGLLGRNNGRYAVTFIDSHDWFLRDDNGNEFCGHGNSLKAEFKPRLMLANAFLLSMPGVPCVFYPHWAKYKEDLKPMIAARKAARVHSESTVQEEEFNATGYKATIIGKEGGHIVLCLGDKAHQDLSADHELFASDYPENDYGHDASYQIWVKRAYSPATGVEEMSNESTIKAEKIMKDGKLFIRMGDKTFDLMGRQVK